MNEGILIGDIRMNILIKSISQGADDFARICTKYKHLVTTNTLASKGALNFTDDIIGDVVQFASKGTKRISGLTDDVLRTQVAEGLSLPQMAKTNGCSQSTIRNHLSQIGLRTLEAERAAQITQSELEKLIDIGYDCKSIAEKYGITEMQLGKLLKKFNLETSSSKFEKMIRKEDIIEMYEAGAKKNQLAEIFGVPEYIIEKTLRRFGLSGYKQSLTELVSDQVDITPQLLRKLIKEGKTRTQIAEELGVLPERITQCLNEFNIPFTGNILRASDVLPDATTLRSMSKDITVEDIAKKYGLSSSDVTDHFYKLGIFNFKRAPYLYEKIEDLIEKGYSINEISKILKKSTEEIRKCMSIYRISVDIPKERFLAVYRESVLARFCNKSNVINLKKHFGITEEEYQKFATWYEADMDKILQEVSSLFRK